MKQVAKAGSEFQSGSAHRCAALRVIFGIGNETRMLAYLFKFSPHRVFYWILSIGLRTARPVENESFRFPRI